MSELSPRQFRLAPPGSLRGVACDENGVFVDSIPAWTIVNRIDAPTFQATLYDVLHAPMQYQFLPEGGTPPKGSKQWQDSANPNSLTDGNATSWTNALAVAEGILNGSILDPTGGATYFFASSDYDGSPESAPLGFFRSALLDDRLSPSLYQTRYPDAPQPNYFFILNPPGMWYSNRRRR